MKKKKTTRQIIRQIVREEVAMAINEVITELKQPTQSQPIQSQPIQEKHYSKNSVLNDVLNETANGEDWETLGGEKFTTERMSQLVGGNYGDMMNNSSTQAVPSSDPMSQFLNKDYKDVLKKSKDIDDCDYFLCTGLFDKYQENLIYYKELFEKKINKKMICTNPDLIVDRGSKRELCAGSVAMVFEKMGGEVVYFGKPYPEVYNQSIDNKNKKVLCIGDNLNTDIKGANLLNFDSLLITNGIHKKEIEQDGLDSISKSYEAICNFTQSELKW